MTSTTLAPTTAGTTTKQKVGLAIGALYSFSNIASVLFPTPDGETGPPFGVLVVDTLLGVIGLVACVVAWRGSRLALRLGAGAIILTTLSALPALFVDVPMAIKALVGASVLITVACVALMFSARRAV